MILHADFNPLSYFKTKRKTKSTGVLFNGDDLHPNILFPKYLDNPELLQQWVSIIQECTIYLDTILNQPVANLQHLRVNNFQYISQLLAICPLSLPDILCALQTFQQGYNTRSLKILLASYDHKILFGLANILESHLKLNFYLLLLSSKNNENDHFTITGHYVGNFWGELTENFLVMIQNHNELYPTSLLKRRWVCIKRN